MWIALGVVLFLLLAFLFCVFPSPRRHAERKNMAGRLIAHRGLHDAQKPENSLAAFRAAVDAKLAIENDIHITKDGEVVVFHDDTFTRMCGCDGRPENMTLREIKALRLAGTEETVPTLRECLDVVDGRVPILVEFKCTKPDVCRRLCEKADEILSDYKGVYWVQSFYPGVPAWYRRHCPRICRGQLASSFRGKSFSLRLLGTLVANVAARPDFVSYDIAAYRYIFFRFNVLLGAFPVGWTYRSEKDLKTRKKPFKTWIFENFDAPGLRQ
ncbi:MAG: glycerophosphodiester phosphodiesterase [Clostridia bacterium]|nr:glycerophosphodiester phosphodiesterase [Clostridia bacterium]